MNSPPNDEFGIGQFVLLNQKLKNIVRTLTGIRPVNVGFSHVFELRTNVFGCHFFRGLFCGWFCNNRQLKRILPNFVLKNTSRYYLVI